MRGTDGTKNLLVNRCLTPCAQLPSPPSLPTCPQGLPKARGAVPCHPHHSAQRAELPEAAQLAVVAPVHQGEAAAAGDECRRAEAGDGGGNQEAR